MLFIRKYANALGWALVASALVLAVLGLIGYGKRVEKQKQAILSLQQQVATATAENLRMKQLRATETAEAAEQSALMQQYQKENHEARLEADQYRVALRDARRVRWSPGAVQPGAGEATPAHPGGPAATGTADVPPAFAARVADLLTESDELARRYNALLAVARSHTCEIQHEP